MKITTAFIDKLIKLRNGETLAASALSGEWVEEMLHNGVLLSRSRGSKRLIAAASPSTIEASLSVVDERFTDLDRLKTMLSEEVSRAEQAAETGNSKMTAVRTCPGFLVNAYQPIIGRLGDKECEICPPEGSMLFVADWEHFSIPEEVIVVGIENMENFRWIRQQRAFFESEISPLRPLLFVSRYPQSTDLRRWLLSITNPYVHFGDFDLAGIHIFLTEFYPHLLARASFLIPQDIESRLAIGSRERYDAQYQRFKHLSVNDPTLFHLIELIHRHHRCYDQEGYISSPYSTA